MGSCIGWTASHARRTVTLLTMLTLALAGASSRATDSSPFYWGAVGHNDRLDWGSDYPYNKIPLTTQVHLLNSSGMNGYRTSCETANCAALVALAKANGIVILKSIRLQPDATITEAANYSRAYSYGVTEANNLGSAFTYFEASNELDNWVGMTGDGSSRSQYDAQRYSAARGLIKGLIDGVHSANASAKVLVDDAGWCHYGFLQMLWQDGVRWDITSFHWYASQGNFESAGCAGANVAAIHAAFGLPVWITEFNSDTAAGSGDPTAAAAWISTFMSQVNLVAEKYNIQGAFVYELLDEPSLAGAQARFGVFDSSGKLKAQSQALAKALNVPTIGVPNPPVLLSVK
jgi:hypothetical protein